MTEHGICAKCKKSVGCPYADDRIKGCKKFVLEPELELTNEEYIRSCSHDELVNLLGSLIDEDIIDAWHEEYHEVDDYWNDKDAIELWLKAVHKE